ncbi:spondin-1-like [Cydia pomonella]|uniref:spondin-1-like n=1 Tax=Cydia pomonella TaxID=82600 RepID=UPI002ADE5839|nr:spondin-1-like [Cydia pomonella]XP_061706107.1 spondin-1-like [Cydia pomonella]
MIKVKMSPSAQLVLCGLLLGWWARAALGTMPYVAGTAAPAPCPRAPSDAQPQDARYALRVAGEPDLFLPGELYTVSLLGVDSGTGLAPFIGFTMWLELDEDKGSDVTQSPTQATTNHSLLGSFQAYDAQTKQHALCFPAVDNATAHPKTEIQVVWSAPLRAVDLCLRLCARVEPANDKGGWSVLTRKLCAAYAAPASFTRQPPILEPCCACDEAKYEVTFEGLWSRNTHPREFPPEGARAHFSDVIGASHTAQYRVWQEGRVASAGLRRLAEDGATTALEKELKAESDHIRTIIKARGISWQQVAGTGSPSTFAVFRVDAKHHLVSLAAKLAPSPDWIVGVSALELCNANCTWSTSATLSLYPYDAGTDSGIAYTSRRQPSVPAAPVRALRPDWPRDARSPFFSTTGEMRPYARLRLNRLRLYEKSCDGTGGPSPEHKSELGASGACTTHTWGAWSACSVTCGEGRASRQRYYMWPARARKEACRAQLTDHRKCRGPRMHCRAISDYEPDPAESSGPCAVTPWSEWSPCEGCGVRARTRHYAAPRAHKRCHVGFKARTILSQALPCDAGPCHRPPTKDGSNSSTISNFDWFFMDVGTEACKVTAWGDWSPCSARCGRGRRLRARLYLARDGRVQREVSRRLLASWNQRFAELQHLDIPTENTTLDDPELEKEVQEQMDRCQFTMSQQEALCDGEDTGCLDSISKETCMLPVSVGHCRSYKERWFFEAVSGRCEPFGYSGCGGNGNNFPTHRECLKRCGQANNVTAPTTTETSVKRLKSTQSSVDNEVIQNDAPVQEDVNCEVGAWLGWGSCFGDCEHALKLNYRLMQTAVSGAGKPCPSLVKSRPCKLSQCRKTTSLPATESPGDEGSSNHGENNG